MSRLAAMGIAPGIWLKVLRNNRGPLLVITNGTRIAIGRGQASRIMITRVGDEKGGTRQ
ncbi:MAG: FeoA family protein [Thermodesulfovibrionales bacterium]|nr:FeoA family protein [Thermodesulfovibrionales bacterium]